MRRVSQKREWKNRLMKASLRLWHVDGDVNVETRALQAKEFSNYTKSAVFAATIDSIPGAITLAGPKTVHVLELHDSPKAMAQAVQRPCLPGSRGITVVYWILRDSIDETNEKILLPKVKMLSNVMDDRESLDLDIAMKDEITKDMRDDVSFDSLDMPEDF